MRAVDHTILVTVNDIAAQQSQATTETEAKMQKLLNYVATHPNATLTYHKSKMQLAVHSDASYLSAPNARSRAWGYFYLSEQDNTNSKPPINAPVHTECKIMKHVLSSAIEAEIGVIFLNCQQAEILHTTSTAMPSKNELRQWICDIIGSWIGKSNVTSTSSGNLERKI